MKYRKKSGETKMKIYLCALFKKRNAMKFKTLPVLLIVLIVTLASACSDTARKNKDDHTENTTTDNISVGEEKVNQEETSPDSIIEGTPEMNAMDEIAPSEKNYSRIGYISSVVILTSLPEVQQAEKQLQNFAQSLQSEIERQQNELQKKYTEYMADKEASQSIVEVRTQELQQMQQRIMQLQQNSEQELSKRKEQLYAPILKKVDAAIAEVAKKYGYTHVIDITAGSMVYADSSTDLTAMVLKSLGINAPTR